MQYMFSLINHNSFGIDAKTENFIELKSDDEIDKIFETFDWGTKFFILGGGSNVLFTDHYDGTIIHVNNKGKSIIEESENDLLIEVAAGEVWEDFVEWTVKNRYYGAENLALIPGQCGSAPVQNIGAYGLEAKDIIHSVNYREIPSGTKLTILANECNFAYRDSIFKNELKNRALITSVVFKLSKKPNSNVTYRSLKEAFEKKNITQPTPEQIYQTVVGIRRKKLPDHRKIGNGGSFFKNPVISQEKFSKLFEQYPDLVHWQVDNNKYKLASAQLIDKCGWKAYRKGDAGVHPKQALVLVNYGNASGSEIWEMAKSIQADVLKNFGVSIEPEVIILP